MVNKKISSRKTKRAKVVLLTVDRVPVAVNQHTVIRINNSGSLPLKA